MDTEDEPTQQCTQPWAPEKQVVDDTTGILCTLFPTTISAKQTVARLYKENSNFVFIPHDARDTIAVNPSKADILSIALRFNPGPLDLSRGFCLGRNLPRCDVIIGEAHNIRRISNIHFRIFVNEYDTLMLEDCSTNGTYVDGVFLGPAEHNNHGDLPMDKRPRSRMLSTGSEIFILKGARTQEIKFLVRIPKSNGCGFQGDGDGDHYGYDSGNALLNPPVAGPAAFRRDMELAKPTTEETIKSASRAQKQVPKNNPHNWAGVHKYMLLEPIGQGAFATVQKGVVKQTGAEVAIKIISRRTLPSLKEKVGARKEVEILESLKHPNIVQYYECLEDDTYVYIIMEYISGGDLGGYIHKHGRMAETLAQDVTRQILHGVQYIHRMGITHRDIKPDNILLVGEEPMVVKISDFGLAKMVENEDTFLKTFCGTMLYLAPEVFPSYVTVSMETGSKRKHAAIDGKTGKQPRRYNQAVDMWSIGCVTYALLTGRPPFEAKTQEDIYHRILSGEFDVSALRSNGVNSKNCIDFLTKLLTVNPALRMVEYAALRHPWLTESERDNDSSFGSSMEVDEPNSVLYMPGQSQIQDEGPYDESEDDNDEGGRTVRHKKERSVDWSQSEFGDITPQATMKKETPPIKRETPSHSGGVSIDRNVKEEKSDDEFSFNFPATQSTGEVLPNDALALSVGGEDAMQSSLGVLGLEDYQFVSARGSRPGSDEEVQIQASQFKQKSQYPASQSRNSQQWNSQRRHSQQNNSGQRYSQPLESQKQCIDGDDITPVGSQIITMVPSSPLPTPTMQRAMTAPAHLNTSTFDSSDLNATRILMSPSGSAFGIQQFGPTVSQQQMPPPVAPRRGTPPPTSGAHFFTPNAPRLVPKCSQEDLLDYSHQDIAPPYWGKLVSINNSGHIQHPNVMLRGEGDISFGRFKPCSVVYTDDRLSKKHCALKFGGFGPKGARNKKPLAWLKCTATNSLWLNGEKVPRETPTAVIDGDEIVFFKDTQRHQVLGFKIHLAPASFSNGGLSGSETGSGGSEDDAMGSGGSGEDIGKDGDQPMGGLN